ncbi:MAG: CoA transferase [Actinomycetota bacterium]|nr:CoA transferase [Actinomycetota bacterium]
MDRQDRGGDGEGHVLAGIRVLELAQNIAIPYCGRMLVGLGAELVKVEPPEGDSTRYLAPLPIVDGGPDGRGYAMTNVGKRSVRVDLADPASRPVVHRLVEWSDVVLMALKPTDRERFEVGYDQLSPVNPSIVYLEHSAFGPSGPDRALGGYDVLVQALSGLSYVTARSDPAGSVPLTIRPAYNDYATGLTSTIAVLAALRVRERTGKGQRVRTSLLSTALMFSTPNTVQFDADRHQIEEVRSEIETMRRCDASFEDERRLFEERVVPAGGAFDLNFRHYRTSDGYVSVGAMSPTLRSRFLAALELPDPRELGIEPGADEWRSFVSGVEELFRARSSGYWIEYLRSHAIPAVRYNLPLDVLDDPQVVDNGYVVSVDHPAHGRYLLPALPVQMERGMVGGVRPSPGLGQHTEEVMAEMGITMVGHPPPPPPVTASGKASLPVPSAVSRSTHRPER